jgi:hypothetical protein
MGSESLHFELAHMLAQVLQSLFPNKQSTPSVEAMLMQMELQHPVKLLTLVFLRSHLPLGSARSD